MSGKPNMPINDRDLDEIKAPLAKRVPRPSPVPQAAE
jgi:hypothetical protein